MYIRRLIYSQFGEIVISVLLGLGLATLFRKVCNNRNCLRFEGAPLSKITDQIFKFEEKCYKFTSDIQKCDNSKKIIDFA